MIWWCSLVSAILSRAKQQKSELFRSKSNSCGRNVRNKNRFQEILKQIRSQYRILHHRREMMKELLESNQPQENHHLQGQTLLRSPDQGIQFVNKYTTGKTTKILDQ